MHSKIILLSLHFIIFFMLKKTVNYFILLVSLLSFSQEFNITGNLKDINDQPISFANIILIQTEDALVIKGTSSDDLGDFLIENINKGTYSLKISFIGYVEQVINIQIDKNINLNTIILQEVLEELEGVTIIAKRPTVKRLVDRLVFNVENSTLSNNNVLDVLKQTPGVLVNDGIITIKQSIPTIYINDRRVHLSISEVQQLLEGTSAGNLKSIEVITNPPAKYEAEGGSVLNIVTNKNIIAGYNGSVFGNYQQGSEFPKYLLGTSHFFKAEKLNTYINYSISPRKDFRYKDETVNFIDDFGQKVTSWETDYNRTRESENQTINANIDYEFNENNNLAFTSNMLIVPRRGTRIGINSLTEVYGASNVIDSIFDTSVKAVDETFNLAFTLDYNHKFKKEGEKLSVSLHKTYYDFSNFQDVNTEYFLPNNNAFFRDNRFQTFSSQEINLYTGQIDYELPTNNSAQFEAGLKVSNINSESILNQFNFQNDIKVEDLLNSDTFLYDETNYAAYTSYAQDWEKWNLKLGLRTEFTNIKGSSVSTNTDNNNDYVKFFPSFYLLNILNENNEIYLSYNKRIYRPRYEELNPFKYFLNDNTFLTGDPNLRPQIDDVFILGYTFNRNYTFEVFYRYENDPVFEITLQDNDENILKYINTNIDNGISYGLDFTTYTQISNLWNLYVLSSIFNYENEFLFEGSNDFVKTEKWSFYAQIINYFSLLKDNSLTLDISYSYISPFVDGPTTVSTRTGLDINLRKTFWDNKASLNIGMIDIFNTQNFNQTTKFSNQDTFFRSEIENRLFTLGFNYKFGNFKLNNNQRDVELNERDRLEKSN